jgi:hypothetical protein
VANILAYYDTPIITAVKSTGPRIAFEGGSDGQCKHSSLLPCVFYYGHKRYKVQAMALKHLEFFLQEQKFYIIGPRFFQAVVLS